MNVYMFGILFPAHAARIRVKIALILIIENPLPRGVVVRTANTNPGRSADRAYHAALTNLAKIPKQLFWLI